MVILSVSATYEWRDEGGRPRAIAVSDLRDKSLVRLMEQLVPTQPVKVSVETEGNTEMPIQVEKEGNYMQILLLHSFENESYEEAYGPTTIVTIQEAEETCHVDKSVLFNETGESTGKSLKEFFEFISNKFQSSNSVANVGQSPVFNSSLSSWYVKWKQMKPPKSKHSIGKSKSQTKNHSDSPRNQIDFGNISQLSQLDQSCQEEFGHSFSPSKTSSNLCLAQNNNSADVSEKQNSSVFKFEDNFEKIERICPECYLTDDKSCKAASGKPINDSAYESMNHPEDSSVTCKASLANESNSDNLSNSSEHSVNQESQQHSLPSLQEGLNWLRNLANELSLQMKAHIELENEMIEINNQFNDHLMEVTVIFSEIFSNGKKNPLEDTIPSLIDFQRKFILKKAIEYDQNVKNRDFLSSEIREPNYFKDCAQLDTLLHAYCQLPRTQNFPTDTQAFLAKCFDEDSAKVSTESFVSLVNKYFRTKLMNALYYRLLASYYDEIDEERKQFSYAFDKYREQSNDFINQFMEDKKIIDEFLGKSITPQLEEEIEEVEKPTLEEFMTNGSEYSEEPETVEGESDWQQFKMNLTHNFGYYNGLGYGIIALAAAFLMILLIGPVSNAVTWSSIV